MSEKEKWNCSSSDVVNLHNLREPYKIPHFQRTVTLTGAASWRVRAASTHSLKSLY